MSGKKETKRIILEKIRSNQVKMRPRWWFVAWAMGLRSGVVVVWLVIAGLMSGLWYWWDIRKPSELLDLGDLGWEVLKSNLPYWLIVELVVLILVGGVLYSKIDENYKKTTRVMAIIMAMAIILLTLVLSLIGQQNELEILLKVS